MAGSWLDKVKDYVKGNPQQADSAIDKVEDVIDKQTGGKYSDQIDKGSDALRDQLGLPEEQPAPAPGRLPNLPPHPHPSRHRHPRPSRCRHLSRGPRPAPSRSPRPATRAVRAGPRPPELGRAGADHAGAQPSPSTNDPQPGSNDGPLIPGEPQQPGQPGGPLDPGQLPGGRWVGSPAAPVVTSRTPAARTGPDRRARQQHRRPSRVPMPRPTRETPAPRSSRRSGAG